MVTLKRVKIIEKCKKYSQTSEFHFFGELTEGQEVVPLWALQKKVKFTLLEWLSLFLEKSLSFWSDFHSFWE